MNIKAIKTTRTGSIVTFSLFDKTGYYDSENQYVSWITFDFSKIEKHSLILFYEKLINGDGRYSHLRFDNLSGIECNDVPNRITFYTPMSATRINVSANPEIFIEEFGELILDFYGMDNDSVLEYVLDM